MVFGADSDEVQGTYQEETDRANDRLNKKLSDTEERYDAVFETVRALMWHFEINATKVVEIVRDFKKDQSES